MKRDRTLDDAEVQAILAGRGGQPGDELTELLDRTRKLVEMPEDRTVARHLAAIVAASTATDLEAAPPTRRSLIHRAKPVVAKLALAVSLLTGSTAGLAYAGVDLPGSAAERAFEAFGISLPNQGETSVEDNGDDKSVSEDVQGVIEGSEERNCEFGQAVAEAASANAQGEQPEPTHDPCDEAESDSTPQGSKATGEAKSAEGKAKAEENKSKGDDAGSEPQGSKDTGESKSEEGKSKSGGSENEPQGSKDTGESKSEEGKSNQDDRSEDRPAQGSGQDPEDVPSP